MKNKIHGIELSKYKKGLNYLLQCNYCDRYFVLPRCLYNGNKANFCSVSCGVKSTRTHQHSPNWKGGKIQKIDGYICLRVTNHPSSNYGYVKEHRLVMERVIGRYLKPEEIVHHIDGDRQNNDVINLVLCKNNAEHTRLHAALKRDFNGN